MITAPVKLQLNEDALINSFLINSRRQPLNGHYLEGLLFLQLYEFELYWGAAFFTTRRGVLGFLKVFHRKYYSSRRCFDLKSKVSKAAV